jgi:hypothetical protein
MQKPFILTLISAALRDLPPYGQCSISWVLQPNVWSLTVHNAAGTALYSLNLNFRGPNVSPCKVASGPTDEGKP